MDYIDLLDKNTSAIFGILGAIVGFFSDFFIKKLDRKNEISKEEAKEYFKQKRIVLNESLRLISEYEMTMNTLYDYFHNENGVPIEIVTKEDIYRKYFLKIFGYLHANRFYLEVDTIEKLDILKKYYYDFIVGERIILSEYHDDKIPQRLIDLKINLYKETLIKFNNLNEEIKYDEVQEFKKKVSK